MEDAARRRFLGVLAGAGVVAAAGGGAAFMANSRDAAAYDAAVEATWRHSDSFELPLPAAQKDLVRYATLAANSHNTQPWQFRSSDRAVLVLPDLTRRLRVRRPRRSSPLCQPRLRDRKSRSGGSGFRAPRERDFRRGRRRHTARPRTGACGAQPALRRDPATSINTRHLRRTGRACRTPSTSGSCRERRWGEVAALHRTQAD